MRQFYKHITVAASILCLCSQGYSAQSIADTHYLQDGIGSPKKRPTPLVRSNAWGDLTPYFAKWDFAHYQTVVESPRITFPLQKELLFLSIQQGCTKLHIYIPQNSKGYMDDQQGIDFSLGNLEFFNVTSLIIEHSAGDARGYWPAAIEALVGNLRSFPNLVEVTLSDILVDMVVPHLVHGTRVKLNSGCYYVSTDSVHPKKELAERAEAQLEYCQSAYPMFPFYLTRMENPFFTVIDDGQKVSD